MKKAEQDKEWYKQLEKRPYVMVTASLRDETSIYSWNSLGQTIVKEVSDLLTEKGVKVEEYEGGMKGAGGESLLDWFIAFYYAHPLVFWFIRKIPSLVKRIKKLLEYFTDFYYRMFIPKPPQKPTLQIHLHWFINDLSRTDGLAIESLKRCVSECFNIIPSITNEVSGNHAELEYEYYVTAHCFEHDFAIAVNAYDGSSAQHSKIMRKMKSITTEHRTYMFYVVKNKYLKYRVCRVFVDKPILV